MKNLLAKHQYLATTKYSSIEDSLYVSVPLKLESLECTLKFEPGRSNISVYSPEWQDNIDCPEYAFNIAAFGYIQNIVGIIGYNIHLVRFYLDNDEIDKFPKRKFENPELEEKELALKELLSYIPQEEWATYAEEAGILDGYVAVKPFFEAPTNDK